jgi:Na+-transporting NADH:ubiquinone oxidoreductase subunit B
MNRPMADLLAELGGNSRALPDLLPGVRNACGTERVLLLFIVASLPAALVGAWSAGADWLLASADVPAAAVGWRQLLLAAGGLSLSPDHVPSALLAGLTLLLPLLFVATATSIAWEIVFASARRRPVDPGWAMSSWLFVLLLPPQTPLLFAALGMSFGAVIGKHVFGGTGRYIASPAAIGALFLNFAYPSLAPAASSWSSIAALGAAEAVQQGMSWWALFAGGQSGSLGTVSALACIAGALWLALAGAASWRTLAGGLAGLSVAALVATSVGGTLPPHWQFALGNVAFCWAFVLTDPTTLPLTQSGRWLHGALFGLLVVLMREADPSRPESTLFAVLLAALLVPLLDYLSLRVHRRRHHRRYGPGLTVAR